MADPLDWIRDPSLPIPQAPPRYQADFVGLNPELFVSEGGVPTSWARMGDEAALLNAIFSPVPNAVNQLNRIGGEGDFGYDTGLTWQDVFANAGYDPGMATLLGLGGELVEPGPGELRALADLTPLLAIMSRLPVNARRALGERVAADLLDEAGLVRPQFHGTTHEFDTPLPSGKGKFGPGYYTTHDVGTAETYGFRGGMPPVVREDTALLQNPFVLDPNQPYRPAVARVQPDQGAIAMLMSYIDSDTPAALRARETLQGIADGTIQDLEFSQFVDMAFPVGAYQDPSRLALLSDAVGIDGFVKPAGQNNTFSFSEIGSYNPARDVVRNEETLMNYLQTRLDPETAQRVMDSMGEFTTGGSF